MIALDALLDLVEQRQRSTGAPRLAERVGATHLCVFIRDPDFGRFIPALGFPQRLPDGFAWKTFLANAAEGTQARATLTSPYTAATAQVTARLIDPDTLSVLFGDRVVPDAHSILAPALKLSGALYLQEMRASLSEVGAALARRNALESRKAAASLNGVHEQLAAALHRSQQLAGQLRRRQERLDLACRISGLGAWEMEAATRIVTLSPRAATILSLPPEPAQHHFNSLLRAVQSEDRETLESAIAATLVTPDEQCVRFRVLSPNEDTRWVEFCGMLAGSSDGDSRTIIGFSRNIPQHAS